MINLEFLRGFFLNRVSKSLALIQVHVRNPRVQAQRVVPAAERPDVDVVNFLHAVDGEHGAGDFLDAHLARAAFQENVGGLAENADAGPQHQQADGDSEERVDPAARRSCEWRSRRR